MTHARPTRTPTLLQMEMSECGAASLGIILAHFGRFVPLTELRQECGVSRDGSKASKILAAAERYGLVTSAYSREIDALAPQDCPFIAFWAFNHFLVVEGWDRRRVYLNDPATGHRPVTWDEFDRDFTGVVLTMSPGPDFVRRGRPARLLPALASRLRGRLSPLLFCVLAGLLLVLPALAIPACAAAFVDSVVVDGHTRWIRPLIGVMVVVAILQGALKALQLRCIRRMAISLSADLSGNYFRHLFHLPVSFHAQRYPGELAHRGLLNDRVSDMISRRFATAAIDVSTVVVYAAVMLSYNVVLTLTGVAFAAGNLLALRWLARRRTEANMRLAHEYGKAAATGVAGVQSIESLKASGLESGWFARWAGQYAKAANTRQQLQKATVLLSAAPVFLQLVSAAAILYLGSRQIVAGQLSIGSFVAFQSLMVLMLAPVANFVNLGGELQELHGDVHRLQDVVDTPADASLGTDDVDGADFRQKSTQVGEVELDARVELRGVTFGYDPSEPPLLQNLSVQVPPGGRLAIVGASGSGKSTVAKLIAGLYAPSIGEIRIGGVPRERIPRKKLAAMLGVVEQDVLLFEGTVRENLTLWNDDVEDSSLIQACRDAVIHDDIEAMPEGYETLLLEGGANLSGGQRQRLEIARALVASPSILVLDEATSALDAQTEAAVMKNLRRRGCTCVIVAHRLSTIRDCDEIIVLEQGRVIERGTHENLLKRNGHYRRLLHHFV